MKNQKISLVLLLCNLFIAFLGIGLVIPVMPSFIKELGLNGEIMGYLVAAFALAQLIASPFTGVWVDKVGRKPMIVFGLFLFSLSELIFAVGSHISLLFLSRILGGISAAFIMPAVTAFVADITTLKERPKVLGYVSASISAGFIIGPGIGGFIAEIGVRAPFYFASVIALAAALFSMIILKEPLTKEELAAGSQSSGKVNIWSELKKSFQPKYLVPLLIVFVLAFGLAAYETMFSLFVDEKFGFTPKDISVIITVGAVFGVIAQVVFFGKLVEWLGEKKLIQVSLVMASVFMFVSVFVSSYAMIMAVTFIVFLGCDILRPAITSLLSRIAGNEQGFVAGMNSTYTSLGNIIGPALAGIFFDINLNLPYIFAGAILMVGFVMTVMWKSSGKIEEG